MSNYEAPTQPRDYSGYMPSPVPPTKKKRKWLVPVLIAVAALLLGGATGAAAKPAEVRTVEVEKVVTKDVTKTPAACLTAINRAEDIMNSSAAVIGLLGEDLKAATRLDAATIKANNSKLDDENAVISSVGPQYKSAKDACRAAQ